VVNVRAARTQGSARAARDREEELQDVGTRGFARTIPFRAAHVARNECGGRDDTIAPRRECAGRKAGD
jgi:hypothetical protein